MLLFRKRYLTLPAIVALCLSASHVNAGQESLLNISITLVKPPCSVEKEISVPFGNDVLVSRIDGNYKKQSITYSLNCGSNSSSPLKMQIIGTGAGFDKSSLGTDNSDLGIALYSDGTRFPLNTYIPFNNSQQPALEAVLVKRAGSTPKEGPFKAQSTLSVEYQ